MGLHCLTIPNCPKSWALISWQFLLVIVLSFTTIDEGSDYYNKKKWVHTLSIYVFNQTHGVGNQKYCRNETVLLSTQNIKPWLQIELTRLQNFGKVYTNSKNRNDSVYTHLHSISTRRITGLL